MSELLLSVLRIGFLLALWWFVLTIVSVLRLQKVSTKLLIVDGALVGTVIPLGNSAILIGRAPDSTVVLDDDFVSTHHARLTPSGKHWMVEDLGSTNGTWIDRTRVSSPTVLRPGTQLRIGRTSMELSS